MISFATVMERAFTGPICTERDFDLDIFVPNLRKVIEKYGIKYDPHNPVPADDDLADRVWEAAMEFLVETGVYCLDTERRILFTKEEIEGALETGPCGHIFGEGKDAKAMPRRFPEDETPPWCSGSGAGCPVSNEQILLNMVKACAAEYERGSPKKRPNQPFTLIHPEPMASAARVNMGTSITLGDS